MFLWPQWLEAETETGSNLVDMPGALGRGCTGFLFIERIVVGIISMCSLCSAWLGVGFLVGAGDTRGLDHSRF